MLLLLCLDSTISIDVVTSNSEEQTVHMGSNVIDNFMTCTMKTFVSARRPALV